MPKSISIIGPESTGKTWLANKLAEHYSTHYVPEYSREYFNNKEYVYDIDDLVDIAVGQLHNEESAYSRSNKLIFCDTDILSISIWSQVVFGKVPKWIAEVVDKQVYDLYLLCNLDVEWEDDPLRKNNHNRQFIYNLFVNELEKHSFNFRIISGVSDERLDNAIKFVDEFLINA